ncbi:MAG: NfeD family protein [Candidatus Micrarchaeota archaeon]|nr:NfeD family protein [Candidatus Micrarchaeota archaeon]
MDFSILLIILGAIALFAELFLPSGIVGALGIGLIVAGALLFLNVDTNISMIIGALSTILSVIAILIYAKHLQKKPIKTGAESLVGKEAKVLKNFKDGKGLVVVESQTWTCESIKGKNYKKGQIVKILNYEGVHLKVE